MKRKHCSEEEAEIIPPVDTSAAKAQTSEQPNTLDAAAIYYIDGEEVSKDAVEKINPEKIHSMNILKGENAIKAFGDKAASGVVAITTKENQNSPEVLEFNKKLSALPPPPPPVKQEGKYAPPYRSDIPVYIPDASNIHEDHSAFLKRNPEVKQLGWMIGDSFDRKARLLVVYLKSGEKETYDLDHSSSVDRAKNKYGELPALPPPPPPVTPENN